MEEEAPVVITRSVSNNSKAVARFLQELAEKQGSQGRYYMWRGDNGRQETNMPEAARLRGREQGKAEERALTKECIEEMLKTPRG